MPARTRATKTEIPRRRRRRLRRSRRVGEGGGVARCGVKRESGIPRCKRTSRAVGTETHAKPSAAGAALERNGCTGMGTASMHGHSFRRGSARVVVFFSFSVVASCICSLDMREELRGAAREGIAQATWCATRYWSDGNASDSCEDIRHRCHIDIELWNVDCCTCKRSTSFHYTEGAEPSQWSIPPPSLRTHYACPSSE